MTDTLNEAKRLSTNGFAIHWLHPKTKRPIGNDWSSKPVLDFKQLSSAYKEGNNIGVRLGSYSRIGEHYLHVIDLDIRTDEFLEDALDTLHALFPEVDDYPVVQSGSSGHSRHFYILVENAYRSKKIAHSSGFFVDDKGRKHWDWEIELFGTGKQVAIPPSIHPDTGKPYIWLSDIDFDLIDMGLGPVVDVMDMPIASRDADLAPDDDEDAALLELVNQPPRGMNVEDIQNVLDALPAEEWCEDREGWIRVGMAIHHELSGSDSGFDLWCDWSSQSEKFDLRDARTVWRSFKGRGSKVTMGTLIKVMREEGLAFKQCLRKLEEATTYRQAVSSVAKYELDPVELDTIIPMLVAKAKSDGLAATKGPITKHLKSEMAKVAALSGQKGKSSIEVWIADEVLRRHYADGDHLIYYRQRFMCYRKGVWNEIEENLIAQQVVTTVDTVLANIDNESVELILALRSSGRSDSLNAFSNAIVGLIGKRLGVSIYDDPFNETRRVSYSVMPCRNHDVWFKDGKVIIRDHKSENRFVSQLSVDQDDFAECPVWESSMERFTSNMPDGEDVIRHLYEVMGYIMQTSREKAVFVLMYGQGSNGKSTIFEVVGEMLGSRGAVIKSLGEMGNGRNSHGEAGLVNKLMLFDDDFKKGAALPDDQLKKYAEMKMITANPKGRDEFNFMCKATPVILTNHWPKTSDGSYGLERRAMVFDMNTRLPEGGRDESIKPYILQNELAGILNHCIEGWARLQNRGHFIEPLSCKVAKSEWMGRRNVASRFAHDCLEFTGSGDDFTYGSDIWETFQRWSMEENSGDKQTKGAFYDALESMPGVYKLRRSKGMGFIGIKIIEEMSQFDDESGDIEDMI